VTSHCDGATLCARQKCHHIGLIVEGFCTCLVAHVLELFLQVLDSIRSGFGVAITPGLVRAISQLYQVFQLLHHGGASDRVHNLFLELFSRVAKARLVVLRQLEVWKKFGI